MFSIVDLQTELEYMVFMICLTCQMLDALLQWVMNDQHQTQSERTFITLHI